MKKILFVCIENSCRSQMAEGFAKSFGNDLVEAHSAGSKPSGKVNPDAIKVMLESGVDISSQKSKGFFDLPVREFDYVITLGCADICPFVPAKQHIDWNIEDPKGKDLEAFRKVRDEIRKRVKKLFETLSKEELKKG